VSIGIAIIVLSFKFADQWSILVCTIGIIYLLVLAYTSRLLKIIIQLRLYILIRKEKCTDLNNTKSLQT